MTRSTLAILLFLLPALNLLAQNDSVRLVQYSPDFRFNNGIYLSFSQVKNNHPIPASRIHSNLDPFDLDFYKNLITKEKIAYFDEFGAQNEVASKNIWGFAQDGKLYINYNGEFNRIPIIGKIGHFIADITVIESYYDPFYRDYYDYYYRNSYYNRGYPRTTRSKEMRQYLVNFETGEVNSYDLDEVKTILMEDPELYDEFSNLRKRKQKDLMFFFIRRFNEKNPIFFPVR